MKMGRSRVWAVVEGVHHDTPYYEGLLVDGAGVGSVEFLQASDFEVDGVSSGGKSHALKVLEALDAVNGLSQENKETKIDVVIFVDRDDDEYINAIVEHAHLHYTAASDVEAEIIYQSNLPQAVARAFSIPRADAIEIYSRTPEPARALANAWSEWIAMRLASVECEWSDTRFAQASQINVPKYGPVDRARVVSICSRVRAQVQSWDVMVLDASLHVSEMIRRGNAHQLVKGKWLAPYIIQDIKAQFAGTRQLPAVSSAQILTACLMTIDFAQVWTRSYKTRMEPVLSR
ncbi:hypothetical protein [Clavibacter capsici]|uniref:hypothetical protein n=1 Tax=Clavibacter capsici TaxID=1874630 RepID=UPI0014281ABB|nr:hypothetical protein [Clavibacter capsici]QIS38951.1 hypothetical protein GW572_06555 [Clavibacter capsici]